ncbi:tetraacyldisaccharide 4'-kinase [Thiorhodovibrio frisius]|uniref:Tetraacyldisaccharide 4'-kinase n=1 Tax=Thiorhodovibrio frisius TaxID=631362 RepID=H8Z5N3_9GAMM|nr:tetraacyldisaccharide 4'-kinase [Thiorhodovibrio frisius]EIC20603.1 tetraacyldisaccharide 4''-kinase [Thiorhodovibrio frisius]WPL21352.1 Tetraacyldisaccharide 4'-kinase [Thiorhodovibrio frisius]
MQVRLNQLSTQLQALWYGPAHPFVRLLAPLGWLYCGIAAARAALWRWRWRQPPEAEQRIPAPVIVVGNLTVGGTGKTPLVLWLAQHLRERGWRPGILTRGYRGQSQGEPRQVPADGDPRDHGDEPVLLAARSGCPVMAGADRVAAAQRLVSECGCNLLLADDGLQHYRLRRNLEILLVDGRRGFGNRRCLPAGPLREPFTRARRADILLTNGGAEDGQPRMELRPQRALNLADSRQTRALAQFIGSPVAAVAGIGHPEQFFALLERQGLRITRLPYPDHHGFTREDCLQWPQGPVLMTEKDAVKCRAFAERRHWYLPVTAVPNAAFINALEQHIRLLEAARAPSSTKAMEPPG